MRHVPNAMPTTRRQQFRHAIVIGGSIAGLLAARVLSEHFDRVTVIERDDLTYSPEPRKGVPQGNHLHALLARGRMIAEALLPGLSNDLTMAGAIPLNAGRDLAWYHSGGWRIPHDSDLAFVSMSRPLLESRIAQRVGALANVTVLCGVRLVGLLSEAGRITGVRVASRAACGRSDEIEADLVVDAMGRGSSTPRWLAELGFAAARSELVGARVAYTTCMFRRMDFRPDWRALIITGKPAPRSGLMFPVEGDRWLVTLAAFFDNSAPQDHDGFLAYARSLTVPDLYHAIRDCEPVSDIQHYRFAGSVRRWFEGLRSIPEGLIAIGDAVCSFNPVYGQGMTVAAIEAEMLGSSLARAKAEAGFAAAFAAQWFRGIAPLVDGAWGSVRLEDFSCPELAHECPLHLRFMQWYMGRVHRATQRSAFVADRFYRVMNFLEPASRLFDRRMIAEVLVPGLAGSPRHALTHAAMCQPRPVGKGG